MRIRNPGLTRLFSSGFFFSLRYLFHLISEPLTSVADPACHFDADADPNPTFTFHFDADPDPDLTFLTTKYV